ncbi:hypothetical protein J4216_06920 [Candidatus Woesearchaeota archaeon]|nr:hypothetical protein [Candidatus Woesearchaeota archaeon]
MDDVQYFLHTENLALNHSIKIDPESPSASKLFNTETLRQIQGKQYGYQGREWTEKAQLSPYYDASSLLLPFLTVPLYYLALVTSINPVAVIGFFTNSVILSLTSFIIFITCMHFFRNGKISFILATAYILTTYVWSYNTGMMLRPLAGLLFTLGFYLIVSKNKNYFRATIAGSCIGLTILASIASIIVVPGLVLLGIFYFYKNKNQLVLFLGGFTIFGIIQIILNKIRFNSYVDFGFGPHQTTQLHNHIDGIIGYIFSLGWGIPFNAPLLILFPVAIYLIWRKNKVISIFLVYCFSITWIFHGTEVSPIWSGYGGWGPRYFTVILPLLVISIGFVLKEFNQSKLFKIGFVSLMVFGFLISLMGKLVWYMYGYAYGWGVLKTHLLNNAWEQINYNIQYAPVSLHIMALSSSYIQNLKGPLSGGLAWGLAPCQLDFYIYCKFGIIPFIIIMMFMLVIGYLVIKELNKNKCVIK